MDTTVPSFLQSVLWSGSTHRLDIHTDRAYIINQILAFGTFAELRWLLHTYDKRTVREVFLTQPIKQYTPQSRHFAQLLLDVTESIDPARYEKTLPRHTR